MSLHNTSANDEGLKKRRNVASDSQSKVDSEIVEKNAQNNTTETVQTAPQISNEERQRLRRERNAKILAEETWIEQQFEKLLTVKNLALFVVIVFCLGYGLSLATQGRLGSFLGLEVPTVKVQFAIVTSVRGSSKPVQAQAVRNKLVQAIKQLAKRERDTRRVVGVVDVIRVDDQEDIYEAIVGYDAVLIHASEYQVADQEQLGRDMQSFVGQGLKGVVFVMNAILEEFRSMDMEEFPHLPFGHANKVITKGTVQFMDSNGNPHPILAAVAQQDIMDPQAMGKHGDIVPAQDTTVVAQWNDGHPMIAVKEISDGGSVFTEMKSSAVVINADPQEVSGRVLLKALLFSCGKLK